MVVAEGQVDDEVVVKEEVELVPLPEVVVVVIMVPFTVVLQVYGVVVVVETL